MADWHAYAFAAVAALYLAVSVLLVVGARWTRLGSLLILACLASSAWAAVLAFTGFGESAATALIFPAETLRFGSWTMFLAALIAGQGIQRPALTAAAWAWGVVLIAGVVSLLSGAPATAAWHIGSVMTYGGLLLSLIGLVLLEQLYRNATQQSRRQLKMLLLALGAMLTYDLFLYSQAALLQGFDFAIWSARSIVNLVLIPMIAIAARRNPDWNLDIFISRQVVFYTSTLVAVGLYLLLTSVGGYLIVLYGGSWGAVARIVFFAGAIIVLATLLFSSALRARAKVFLAKHFFRNKYDYREEWLRLVSTLADFGDSNARTVVIRALAQVVGSPGGLLWVAEPEGGRYELADSHDAGDAARSMAADEPMVRFMATERWLIDLDEFRHDPDLYGNTEMPAWLLNEPRAWLVVPLNLRGELPGFVLLFRPDPVPSLNYEDRDLLKTIGHHIAVHLAQKKSDDLLTQARQFEAYNRLTAFLMHDLNNLIAQQSLIVKNADRHKRNPEFIDDAMSTIASSVTRMRRIMDQIKRRDAEPSLTRTVLKFIASSAVDGCLERQPVPELQLENADLPIEVDREKFVMVLTHLIRNAQEATPPDGKVVVRAGCNDDRVFVAVSDSGKGMSDEFIRERLFRPFDSTKGVQGMGIGAYQARSFARGLGGDLLVESSPGAGSTITIELPADAVRPADGQPV